MYSDSGSEVNAQKRKRRAGIIAVLCSGVAVAVLTTGLFLSEESSPQAPQKRAEATPTSQLATTTTTVDPPAFRDAAVNEVATAIVPVVAALAELPPDAPHSPNQAVAAEQVRATFAPVSTPRAEVPEIPSVEKPVVGRRRTPLGWEFDNPTPFGNPLTFVVTEVQGDWLKVQIPVRPNMAEAWIRAIGFQRSTNNFRSDIAISDRFLRAYSADGLIAETPVVVGKDSSRTPQGRYYITDAEERRSGSAYGPWVLPISAFSQDLNEFSGGAPLVAMHGTNRPDLLGTAASNGCIRMPDEVIQRLKDTLPFGTAVDIHE